MIPQTSDRQFETNVEAVRKPIRIRTATALPPPSSTTGTCYPTNGFEERYDRSTISGKARTAWPQHLLNFYIGQCKEDWVSAGYAILAGLAALSVVASVIAGLLPERAADVRGGLVGLVFLGNTAVVVVGVGMLLLRAVDSAPGVELPFSPPATLTGILTVAAGLPGLLFALGLSVFEDGDQQSSAPARRRGRGATVALLLLLALAAPYAGLSIVAYFARDGTAYAERYGTKVTVTVPDECTHFTRRGITNCSGARWSIDGQPHTGVLRGTPSELGHSVVTAETVEAYVIGDHAYTEGRLTSEGDTSYAALGQLPATYGCPCVLALLALAGFLRVVSGNARSVKEQS